MSQPDPLNADGSKMVFDRSPLYAVLFSTNSDLSEPYLPIVPAPSGSESGITVPHGLDQEVAVALPGLWYCLHLPSTFHQLVDIQALGLKRQQALHLDHQILLLPIEAFDKQTIPGWRPWLAPTLVICPDDLLEDASRRSIAMGFALPAASYSQLSDASLRTHWRAIHRHFVSGTAYLGRELTLTSRLDIAPTDLPRRWLSRQMTSEPSQLAPSDETIDELMNLTVRNQLILATLASLEEVGTRPEDLSAKWSSAVAMERARMRFPLTLALTGVAPAYIRDSYTAPLTQRIKPMPPVEEKDIWSPTMAERSDNLVERATIEFVSCHQALARSGVGLMLGDVPRETFTVLAKLERHFIDGPNGPTVWRLLDDLNDSAGWLWTDATSLAVRHASMITVFSNFPIGLFRYPGDSTCLTNRVPIAYRPLLPLTRTLQRELLYVPPIDMSSRFHVLVAECIPKEDRVGRESRSGWQFVERVIRTQNCGITIELVEALSLNALRSAIVASEPDILVISAHGYTDTSRRVAGVLVGNEFYLGPEIDNLPAVVILSACHVAPRGAGTVSITDLLLREGAIAVLGTQVPVGVRHNSMLMMRFFLYMAEVLAGREQHSNLLEVWHHVQASNAINDILSGGLGLHSWAMANGPSGVPVITEFMQLRSPGRLRLAHVYQDTERILGEIADDQGRGDQVRNWFKSPGYVPESLFYVFAGRPERIYLQKLGDVASRAAGAG